MSGSKGADAVARLALAIQETGEGAEGLHQLALNALRAAKVEGLELVKAHVERRIKFIEQLLGGTDPHTQRHVAHAEVIEYCEARIAELERESICHENNAPKS